MCYLPVSLRLKGRLCLVIGGGQVAVRKVESLLKAGAKVRLISPQVDRRLKQLAQADWIEWKPRRWKKCDLDRAWLVIAATSDPKVNRRIKREAERRRLWVNAVDDPENCSLFFLSFFNRGELQVAVSTGGLSPALARKIRETLDQDWNPNAGKCLEWIAAFRAQVKKKIPDPARRFRFWDQALSPQVIEMIRQGKIRALQPAVRQALARFQGTK
jgi:precorrin-2 dehydrogenase/sirohydrochlorin ferrochelatase